MNALPTPAAPSLVQKVVDRRLAMRARLGTTVTVTVADRLIDAYGADISTGGMRLVASLPARVGEPASLVFFLDGEIVSARGVVRWCSRTTRGLFAIGVAFTSVEDDGEKLVAAFCKNSIS